VALYLPLKEGVLLLDKIYKSIRLCKKCGKSDFKIDLFCEDCWQEIYSRHEHKVFRVIGHQEIEFKIYSMFLYQEESEEIKCMINSLKGGWGVDVHKRLAKKFIAKWLSTNNAQKFVFVPAPPRILGAKDHAYRWAEALSRELNTNVSCPLRRVTQDEQKRLQKKARWTRKLICSQDFNNSFPIVFLDDLITTGATAYAAWEALNKPQNFQVWTLAYRPLRSSLV